ncbi:amidohydrolase family protein [Vreelandella malpeensis]|uniref:Amidohydrolase family protein n=1 Tax=Vreelandella malpeensis TaxID=1172368 RepID=A0ABS8DSH4_9GAMM|nr:amidohydrolase family protein [Halomonas malpeensis]MCB8888988.1 amidohydrolase family protein [Halomonas malpeensis]
MEHYAFAAAVRGSDFTLGGPCRIGVEDGVIKAVDQLDTSLSATPRRMALPALSNAHDHGRPLSSSSFGAAGKPLETWLLRLAVMPSVDPYLAACAAFGRAAEGGCAAVMMHCTRPQGLDALPLEVRAVAKAARAVGIRLTFAVGMRDRNPLIYGHDAPVKARMGAAAQACVERYFQLPTLTHQEQLQQVEEVARAVDDLEVDIQFGPTGVQWCSQELLEGIATMSASTGRRVHMHLLETRHQRAWADEKFPQGIVRYLSDIGLLSPRLTLAHCTWARPDELELIAESGATIAINTSSNLHLRSGLAPVAAMWKAGCNVAMGVDGCALDEDDDAIRELRLNTLLHGPTGVFEDTTRQRMLAAATTLSRASLGHSGQALLAPGHPADWMTLNLEKLDPDQIMPLDCLDLFFSRATRRHLDRLVVRGRSVIEQGTLVTLNLEEVHDELRAMYRQALHQRGDLIDAWPDLEQQVAAHYRDRAGCC